MSSARESRPDRNAFVERSHRSLQQECLSLEQPHTRQEVAEATSRFVEHSNKERPSPRSDLPPSASGSRPPAPVGVAIGTLVGRSR